MMSAHMDTVVPGEGVKPVVEGDIIRTDGTTVLGGDDKSGCAVIIEVIRCLQEQNIPHAPIEAIFSICEEVGLLGAKNVDISKLKAKYGIVFDSDDPGFLFTKGPSSNHMEFRIHGLESHAGVVNLDLRAHLFTILLDALSDVAFFARVTIDLHEFQQKVLNAFLVDHRSSMNRES